MSSHRCTCLRSAVDWAVVAADPTCAATHNPQQAQEGVRKAPRSAEHPATRLRDRQGGSQGPLGASGQEAP